MMQRTLSLVILVAAGILAAAPLHAQQGARPTFDAARRQELRERGREILREKLRWGERRDPKGEEMTSLAGSVVSGEKAVMTAQALESETHAAINPVDSNNIVISAIRSSTFLELPIYYTKDFGATWHKSSFGVSEAVGGDPVLEFDANGTLYFSWIMLEIPDGMTGRSAILVASSTDGGATWGSIDTIYSTEIDLSSPFGLLTSFGDKQWLATDRSNSPHRGTLYVAYMESLLKEDAPGGMYVDIVVRRRPAGASTFIKQSVHVSNPNWVTVQFASIGVDLDGRVHVFFWGNIEEQTGTGRQSLWHAVSTDGAKTFTEPRRITDVRFPQVDRLAIPSHLPQRLGVHPQFAVDAHPESPFKGSLYAVFTSNDLGSNDGGTMEESFHIYFCRSSDGGETWSTAVRMNDDSPSFRADHFLPSIDVAPNGTVVLTWYDGRSAAENSRVHYYTTFSTDGGRTFPRNIQVTGSGSNVGSMGSFGTGDYNKTLSTSGYAIPVWADGRKNNGNLDIYAAFIPFSAASVGVERIEDVTGSEGILALEPNPATDRARVRVVLRAPAAVTVDVLDMSGRTVRTITEGMMEAGEHDLVMDCSGLPAGGYLYRLRTPSATYTTRGVIQQ